MTPALPQPRPPPPQTELQLPCSNPQTPAVPTRGRGKSLVSWGRETRYNWAALFPKKGLLPQTPLHHLAGRERGEGGIWQLGRMEKSWQSIKGSARRPGGCLQASHCWPCPLGHTPGQGSLRKTPCGGHFKGSLQHFGNRSRLGVLQRHQLTPGREPGAETTFVILV